ncbi:MAG TPA: RagB/SusD family nutrient uptake outer membrane protein [Puia sp.]|nr:RagB/SusD family nutrient uptake outer membrane protein [Puia sp.]
MQKKLFLYPALFLTCGALLVFSCKKSFLDVQPKGQLLESNYYQTPDEAYAALVATYDPLGQEAGSTDNTYADPLGGLNAASDECYAGGGGATDMSTWQAWNSYSMTAAVGPQAVYWDRSYTGIYRANLLLTKIDGVKGLDASLKARYIAEAKWLRAYYYFWLVRLFKNVILVTEPIATSDIYNQVQVSPDAVYTQIEKDLKEAIPDLPATIATTENGRVSKGAANALLGKVIIYENNNSRMAEAAGYLEQVNGPGGGYSLLPNYADIFNPANKFNRESIFEIYHTAAAAAGWGNWPNFEGNVYVQMTGPRSYSGPIYNSGWSFNPIIPAFAAILHSDPRYNATVMDADSITAATSSSYTPGYANTGKFINKFAPLKAYTAKAGAQELNYPNDYIEIRLADTYLLEAEALVRGGGDQSKAQQYLDLVRARVGLSSIPATLDNIYNERMLELATEGHRWFDLVRTGKAASVLAFKGFKAGVNEILPIPLVELNNTKLKQNPGYN